MGRLIVQTLTDRNCIAAFVATPEGMPASGLSEANFKVRKTAPGADGSKLVIVTVTSSPLRGFYIVCLAPATPEPVRKGLYVFDLIVQHGEDSGEALSGVFLR